MLCFVVFACTCEGAGAGARGGLVKECDEKGASHSLRRGDVEEMVQEREGGAKKGPEEERDEKLEIVVRGHSRVLSEKIR